MLQAPNTRCIALYDVDDTVLARRGKEVTEGFGNKPALYKDYRALLDNQDVDPVIVGTPELALLTNDRRLQRMQRCLCRKAHGQLDRGVQPNGRGNRLLRRSCSSRTVATKRRTLAVSHGLCSLRCARRNTYREGMGLYGLD